MHHALTPVLPPAAVREARRQLNNSGEVSTELLGPLLARSWQRCASAGLQPDGRTPGTPHASAAQLARALELQRDLLSHARPVMEFLHEQTRDTDSMVILADAQGMLLHALGDARFIDRAERVALRPGATWHERWRGTNAIGTALQEAQPVSVHAGEHFLERNGFLTCAAAPIHDPTGRVLGALDLSGDHRGFHRHTLGLVRSAVRMIEHGLFQSRHGQGLRLRLHAQREGLGSLTEGLLALSEDGWLVGANDSALKLLGLTWTDVAARRLPDLLALETAQLLASAHRGLRQPQPTQTRDGRSLWWVAEADRQTVASLRPPAPVLPAAADALAALDTGDSALRAALERARRVQGKPIALLLLGESGVGKEVFARAVHASGPRHEQAFVAVNCAALPETLIEAELFGYRPGAFTGAHRDGAPGRIREADGGTLFLDEIGDMPLAMQGRLLRVLQERQVTPLGGGKPVPVDVQLVCATHRPLREDMKAGRFREDLYYRINGLALQLPPLRERQDLAELVQRLLGEIRPGLATTLSPELTTLAARYAWPGNLRQLANALRTACALMDEREDEIGWEHLPDDLAEDLRLLRDLGGAQPTRPAAEGTLRDLERQQVEAAMALARGNVSEAARRLGVSRNTLYRRLRQGGA
ncbi:sigma-54-dependent Fis family transcriptional regulator [Ideonella sp. 4Y11]|uniref:Sigma-54-dependent Fis family transcriptional regulator n=1 Tax=Ideonella aquatica TaxID=2824119 RepID=A0A940YJ88_9BURK|nr:sigma-54-dependent Fis family transcriptional regulator [Ideonella aquatica]MBQ0958864.1 sigma-54-dependent Fis family transcriptional regulator [Ideonella aquatica]